MKAGWKTRIDERRYFEEKRKEQEDRVLQGLYLQQQIAAMKQQEQEKQSKLVEKLKHYLD